MKLERYNDNNVLMNFLRNTPASVKNFMWSAGRFAVFMLIGMPFVDKIINKIAGAIFGNHYDGMAERENLDAKEKQEEFAKKDLEERLYHAQAVKTGVIPAENTEQKVSNKEPNFTARKQNRPQMSEERRVRDNYTYIPSQDSVIEEPKTEEEKVNKYIPSQKAADIKKSFDNSGLDSALKKADKAEKRAMQILAGKFPD